MADNYYTEENLVILLNQLFVNMNNLDATYYDMFYNQTPMDINLERYNSNGELKVYTIPNRAKDRAYVTIGKDSPEGVVVADIGAQYIDEISGNAYYKAQGYENTTGWSEYYTQYNFKNGEDYLAPNGDGSKLTKLKMSQFNEGVLPVVRGGTGRGEFGHTGLLKVESNSENETFGLATPDVDYVSPSALVGSIMIVAAKITRVNVPVGWLIADGSYVSKLSYPALEAKLTNTWGDEIDNKFKLPDKVSLGLSGLSVNCTVLIKY